MDIYTSSTGNTVMISPFMENEFMFTSLWMEEYLGGLRLASGRIKMIYSGNNDVTEFITSNNFVEIKIGTTEKGTILTVKGLITERSYNKNFFSCGFICVPDSDIFTKRLTYTYKGIDQVISSLWHGNIDKRQCESDLPGDIEFNQSNEISIDFLRKVLVSYKERSIFSFSLDGLIIKDIIGYDSDGIDESNDPQIMVSGGMNVVQDASPDLEDGAFKMTYNKRLYEDVESPLEKMEENPFVNFDIITKYKDYNIIGSDYNIIRKNKILNESIINSALYNQIDVNSYSTFSEYRVGDVVKYKRYDTKKEVLPFDLYIISHVYYYIRTESNSEDATPFPFEMRYKLHCLQDNEGNILPLISGKSPVKSDEEKKV